MTTTYYKSIIAYDLIIKQNYTSVMQLARLDKIVLNTTSKLTDKNFMVMTLSALELLSGQKAKLTYARKSIANFKIREHQLIGCHVILRKALMYNLLYKLCKMIFSSSRDSKKSQLAKKLKPLIPTTNTTTTTLRIAAHSIGLTNLLIFPELETNYDIVQGFHGMTVTFVFSHSTTIQSSLVLSGFQVPFY